MRQITWQEAAERVSNPVFGGLKLRTKVLLGKLLRADSEIGDAALMAAIRVASTRGALNQLMRERTDDVPDIGRAEAA